MCLVLSKTRQKNLCVGCVCGGGGDVWVWVCVCMCGWGCVCVCVDSQVTPLQKFWLQSVRLLNNSASFGPEIQVLIQFSKKKSIVNTNNIAETPSFFFHFLLEVNFLYKLLSF